MLFLTLILPQQQSVTKRKTILDNPSLWRPQTFFGTVPDGLKSSTGRISDGWDIGGKYIVAR